MSRIQVPLGPQQYKAQVRAAGNQRCVNMFADDAPPGSDVRYSLVFLPGTEPWLEVGTGPIRGYHVFLEELFVASGTKLYRINSAGVQTDLGTIPGTIEEKVQMADNGFELVIVTGASDGHKMYYTDGTAAVAQVTDPDLPQVSWVEFMDQSIIIGEVGTQKIFWSAVADATDWDALDFASAENAPDKLRRGLRDHDELALFGAVTVELWYNAGDVAATFQRAPSGVVEIGCAAAGSPAKMDNSTYFLARDKGGLSVRRLEGRVPVKVSHSGVDAELALASTVADAYGFTFTHQGHAFYVLTLPTAGQTHVYDRVTQLWHSWRSDGYQHWRPLGVFECFEQLLVADSITNQIGRFKRTVYREFGSQIPWEVTGAPVNVELRQGTVARMILEIESGTALRSGQGSAPVLFLTWSDNNGKTWANPKRKEMGLTGKHKLLSWPRLGSGTKRIFKWYGAEPIATGLVQAYIDAQAERV
jgi:hypothetical protein